MFWRAHRRIADANETFLELVNGPNPITRAELAAAIEKRPEVWGRFAAWLSRLV